MFIVVEPILIYYSFFIDILNYYVQKHLKIYKGKSKIIYTFAIADIDYYHTAFCPCMVIVGMVVVT